MKSTVLFLALTLLTAGTTAMANPHHQRGDRHGLMGDAMKMVHRLERAAEALDISDTQMDQILSVVDSARPEFRDLRRAMRDNRKAIKEASTADQYDADQVAALAADHGELAARLIVLGSQVRHDIHSQLTTEQRSKLAEMKERRKRGRHH